ncbi:hypothetical protein TL16_g07206 [Triparma laevis f. inornata]|uniref:Uncharacterized protein n=1 Tax=Triparma laevis f. inornata TaxID=1714386 RepID=A0A9W7EHD5_9STRA|nr:hypothetical protein TL16_g07206 [Triparma laevis f. inornata]
MDSLKLPAIGGGGGGGTTPMPQNNNSTILSPFGGGNDAQMLGSLGGSVEKKKKKKKKNGDKDRSLKAGGELESLDMEREAKKERKRRKEEKRRRKLAAAAAASGGDGGVGDCGGQEGQPPLMANSAPIHLQQDPGMTPKNFMLESAMSISGDVSRMSPFFADNVDQSQDGPYSLGSGEKLVVKKGKTRGEENHDKDERRRKKEKKRKKKEIKAAIMLQNVFRSKFARAVAHRMRRHKLFALAAQSGVLLACEGTEQGLTGWYQQTEESIPVYYEVNERGEWKLIM